MPDTTNRPTPRDRRSAVLAAALNVENDPIENRDVILKAIEGCVIIHPADVPTAGDKTAFASYDAGWNACRSHVFGDDQ